MNRYQANHRLKTDAKAKLQNTLTGIIGRVYSTSR